jgi:asparagine synthase (glutamine-hydrolysing)
MPGIAGLVTRMPRGRAEAELAGMVASMAHEPFYETGTFVDEAHGVYVGWCARKGSFAAEMPLRSADGDVVLTFAGEEFSNSDLPARPSDGAAVAEHRGSSYLLRQYANDPTFPAFLNGRFQGLVVDRTRGIATLFNDRYGMQRVHYHQSRDAFYFAAEAKAILAVRPELRRANARSLGELVSLGCVLDNRTLFEGVEVLPGASKWSFRAGTLDQKGTYFQPKEWEEQSLIDDEQYYRELRDVFARNLPRYFGGRERVGISLTGGLDTRMIMAWHKPAPDALPCYTFGGSYRSSRDVIVARQVARACRQSHGIIAVGDEFLSRFPRYAERTVYLTDGCADVSRSADLYVNELAREIAPVRMTGNYGGEVLRRIRAFKPVAPVPGLYDPGLLSQVHRASETYARTILVHPLSFAVFRQAPWHHYGLLALEQTQLALRTPYLDNDLVRTIFRAPLSSITSDESCLRLIEEGDPAVAAIPTDRGLGKRGLAASAARAVHQFSFKAEYAYDYGMPQWMARLDHRLSPLKLERLFLGRHKFYHYRVWYRDALAGYVREMLLDRRTLARPYLAPKRVESIVNGHLRGDENHTLAIHKLLTLELLHRLFLDSAGASTPSRGMLGEAVHAS